VALLLALEQTISFVDTSCVNRNIIMRQHVPASRDAIFYAIFCLHVLRMLTLRQMIVHLVIRSTESESDRGIILVCSSPIAVTKF